jgi:hypothetical protein
LDDLETIDLGFRPETYWSTAREIEYPNLAEAPGFGGGSYLPEPELEEVDIAGVALASTTGDVVSVRATRVPEGIRFGVVDEYETRFTIREPVRPGPLTLGELVDLMATAEFEGLVGLVEGYLDLNWRGREGRGDPDELRDFVVVVSPFYPQLARAYASRVDAWVERRRSG